MEHNDIPINDPTLHLSPTAARILEAAGRLLFRDGFRALTFEAIAREADANQALIRYHFGNKAGLVTALVDSVLYLESVELVHDLSVSPPGEERRKALFQRHEAYAHDLDSYRMFYEIVPHVLRDEELRPHLSDLFEWYRKLDAWALEDEHAPGAAALSPLALLTVAIADGVALQVQADPDLDVGPAFELWTKLVLGYLGDRATASEAADAATRGEAAE